MSRIDREALEGAMREDVFRAADGRTLAAEISRATGCHRAETDAGPKPTSADPPERQLWVSPTRSPLSARRHNLSTRNPEKAAPFDGSTRSRRGVSLGLSGLHRRHVNGPRLRRGSERKCSSAASTLDARARALATHAACAIGMGVVYFLACHIALSIDITDGAASVWPASGLLFGVLLLTPNRLVPPVLLGTLVGGIVANLGVGFDAATSIGYSCIDLGEGVDGTLARSTLLAGRTSPQSSAEPLCPHRLWRCRRGCRRGGRRDARIGHSARRLDRRCWARGRALTSRVS